MFIGRVKELEKLEELYGEGKQKFVAVYGRRRIGKTMLLNKFMEEKEGINFVSFRGSRELLFKSLTGAVSMYFSTSGLQYAFTDLDELFAFVFRESLVKHFVFIIDEFAYLAELFPEASSLLQKYIDLYKEKGKLMLILSSSSRSFMENEVIGLSSPLYGRRDLSLRLEPFGITDIKKMLPLIKDNRDIFKVWAITGGVPLYLQLFSKYENVDEAVKELFFEETGYFVNEVPLMFLTENRNSRNYSTICTLLSSGVNKVSELASKTGLSTSLVTSVLESLSDIDIVEREVSVSPQSRKPVWRIKDNLVAFYYRFRYPYFSYTQEQLMMNYSLYINGFLGFSFERLCRKALVNIIKGKFIVEIGRWWGGNPVTKTEEEIDIAAWTQEGELTACECRYTTKDISEETINSLIRRAALINNGRKTTYIIFTKEKTSLQVENYPGFSFYSLDDVISFLS